MTIKHCVSQWPTSWTADVGQTTFVNCYLEALLPHNLRALPGGARANPPQEPQRKPSLNDPC